MRLTLKGKSSKGKSRIAQHGPGKIAIAATVDGDEIGGRGEGGQPVVGGDPGKGGAGLCHLFADLIQPVLIGLPPISN